MEFAGKDFIYLSKLKKDKIRKIRKAEEDNKGEAPILIPSEIEKKLGKYNKSFNKPRKGSDISEDSDDGYIQVNSNNFGIDLVNPNQKLPVNNMMNNNMMMNNMMMNSNMNINQQAAPGIDYKKAIDTNIFVIRYNSLEKEPENMLQTIFQCPKCKSYLNKYSNLKNVGKNVYEWKCEFCFNLNSNLYIEKNNIPKEEIFDYCIQLPKTQDKSNSDENDDSSLIFCFDISRSMNSTYSLNSKLKEKYSKDSISRIDMVKLAMENILYSLIKNSPNIKVGLISFGDNVVAKGDCLSNPIYIQNTELNDVNTIKNKGLNNKNIINAPIKKSFDYIKSILKSTFTSGCTALGPAVLLSVYLLNDAKMGSRIFLCTDGESNKGVGAIHNTYKAINFYTKVGNIAKEKGIIISLITFKDSESSISILKHMVEPTGGDIFRVDPNDIFDEFNDFLENKAIASEVEIKINLNKCMTFRDEEKKDLINDESSIIKKIGNVTKEKESYYELKFKQSTKLADMTEIDFDKLKNLIFQIEIKYTKKNGGKYIRIITKNLKVSDNKEEINKIANMNILSTLQIQKSAKLAEAGKFMEAQAQIHIARNYMQMNQKYNPRNISIFNQFNNNMNSFNSNLNMNNMMMRNPMQMNGMNNMMMRNPMQMSGMNNMMMDNSMQMSGMNNMMMGNSMQMNNMNNMMMGNSMPMNDMNNMMMGNSMPMNDMNNKNMMNNDLFSQQIYSLANTSENRQNMMYLNSNKNI